MSNQGITTFSLVLIVVSVIAIEPLSGSVSVASYPPVDYAKIYRDKAARHGQAWPAAIID